MDSNMMLSRITLLIILTTGRCNSVIISQHHCSVAGNGNHLNSYYVCEANSESVELFVNKGSVGGFIQKSEVGKTKVGNINFGSNDGYKYSTILLWARQVDNTTRIWWVVAVVVSHPYEAYVYVDCRGQTLTEVAFRNDSCPNPVVNNSRENSNAKINYVLNSTNIIPPYSTFIFTCNVWDQSLFWKINGLLVGQLDSQEKSVVFQLQESDSTAVRVVALRFSDQSVADELSDQNRTLESVLIISGDNISSITCGSSEGSSVGSITYNLFSNPDSTSNDENCTTKAVINVSSLPTTKDDGNNSPTTDDDPKSTKYFNSTIVGVNNSRTLAIAITLPAIFLLVSVVGLFGFVTFKYGIKSKNKNKEDKHVLEMSQNNDKQFEKTPSMEDVTVSPVQCSNRSRVQSNEVVFNGSTASVRVDMQSNSSSDIRGFRRRR